MDPIQIAVYSLKVTYTFNYSFVFSMIDDAVILFVTNKTDVLFQPDIHIHTLTIMELMKMWSLRQQPFNNREYQLFGFSAD